MTTSNAEKIYGWRRLSDTYLCTIYVYIPYICKYLFYNLRYLAILSIILSIFHRNWRLNDLSLQMHWSWWAFKWLNNKHRESLCLGWDSKPFYFMTTGGWNSITRLVGIPSPCWSFKDILPRDSKDYDVDGFFSPPKETTIFFYFLYYPHFFKLSEIQGGQLFFSEKLDFQSRSNSSCVRKYCITKNIRSLELIP